jgi:phosphocarrier protein HPr
MPQTEVEVVNRLGMHARPAAKLTQLAGQYQSDIWLKRNGRQVNAKSIMGVMMLAAAKGARLEVGAEGADADAAIAAIAALIAGGFGESEPS